MKVLAADFVVDSIQTVVYTPDMTLAASRFIASVMKYYGERYDGEIEAVPLPPNYPPDLPRVVLRSLDSVYRAEASLSRVNSIWQRPAKLIGGVDIAELARECSNVQAEYVKSSKMRVGRLALIVNRVLLHDDPAKTLITRFCNPTTIIEPFNRSTAFEIHNHKQYSIFHSGTPLAVNSWVRCKTAKMVDDGRSAILVEQDINTLAEELDLHRFDPESMSHFFEMAASELNEILRKYFPA